MNTTLRTLTTRTLYGLIFAVAMVGTIVFSPMLFFLLMLFFVFEGSREMVRLHHALAFKPNERIIFYVNALTPFIMVSAINAGFLPDRLLILLLIPLLSPYLHALFSQKHQATAILSVHWQILFFIVLPASLMIILQDGALLSEFTSPFLLLSIVLLIWINDIFAYLFGISVGRHKLFSRISPKKTWEGSLGGLLASLVAAYLMAKSTPWIEHEKAMPLAFIIVITGSLGDLIESMLKRQSGIKDTGTLIPGHGGVLDRFDATFFAMPFVFAYLFLTY